MFCSSNGRSTQTTVLAGNILDETALGIALTSTPIFVDVFSLLPPDKVLFNGAGAGDSLNKPNTIQIALVAALHFVSNLCIVAREDGGHAERTRSAGRAKEA
jgi:hypothetical protein